MTVCLTSGTSTWPSRNLKTRVLNPAGLTPTPIVRIFALLDRRLGKRRLAALADVMETELDWVRPFYRLRMEAEGLKLLREKEIC